MTNISKDGKCIISFIEWSFIFIQVSLKKRPMEIIALALHKANPDLIPNTTYMVTQFLPRVIPEQRVRTKF